MSVYLEMQIEELEDEITCLKALNQKLQLEKNELKEQLNLGVVSRSLPKDTKQIFRWLLGYEDFPQRVSGEGRYYWRKYLRRKLSEIGVEID